MNTKGKSFVETAEMRITEKGQARRWFQENPDKAICRADKTVLI